LSAFEGPGKEVLRDIKQPYPAVLNFRKSLKLSLLPERLYSVGGVGKFLGFDLWVYRNSSLKKRKKKTSH